MAARSEAARLPAPFRVRRSSRPRPRARRRTARPGVAGGVVSIGLVAILLAGVVALNVAVLRLNVRLDQLNEERAKLHADNAALVSRLSSASASPRIYALAERQGLVLAGPTTTSYVRLDPGAR